MFKEMGMNLIKKLPFIFSTIFLFLIVCNYFFQKTSKKCNDVFKVENRSKEKNLLSSIYYEHIEEFLL
ncbi:hypothetical protein BU108_07750 [Staphylococcus xylosus]|nr:hypothetical protein BU108_07750 [Staphylococcus xylosus]